MKIKKVDIFLLIFGLILVLLTIIFSLYPELGKAFNLSEWSDPETADYDFSTGLLIVGIACFLGALVPFPVPYTIIVGIVALQYIQSDLGWFSVVFMVIIATLTNVVGDFIDWLIGRGGGYLAEKERMKEEDIEPKEIHAENRWARIVYNKPILIPFLLLLFGMTPLPDSLLFMPLGVIKYSLKKTMIWNGIGKFLMMLLVAILGVFTFDFLFTLLGGSSGETGWVSGMVVLFLSWLLMLIMTRGN